MSKYQIQTDNIIFKQLEQNPIAFFCSEYGFDDSLPIYAGGLGILSGDLVMEAGVQGLPLVAIGLMYQNRFAVYSPQAKHQDKKIDPTAGGFTLLQTEQSEPVHISIPVKDRLIHAQVWAKTLNSAHIFLLDTNLEANQASDRLINDYLYPDEVEKKLLQGMILGLGGVELLNRLGIKPSVYHLNEGHTALVALGLLAQRLNDHPEEPGLFAALGKIKNRIVATKHTILPVAGIFTPRNLLSETLQTYLQQHRINFDEFFALGQSRNNPDFFSTTRLLTESTNRINAVSISHAIFEKRDHPHSQLIPITNGVSRKRWSLPELSGDAARKLSDAEIWKIHCANRQKLIQQVKSITNVDLDPDALTVVWAKRITAYKRLDILLADPNRLSAIVSKKDKPVNIIVSGSARSTDQQGRELMDKIISLTHDSRFSGRVIYLPGYSISLAQSLVQGADVWLNTPLRGNEACGTSGMKAGLNGALQFSTSDGWIDEIKLADKGWILPEKGEETAFYDIIEKEIVPLFYDRNNGLPEKWVKRMRLTMDIVTDNYTARRMLQDYLNRLYFPSPDDEYKLFE